MVTDAQVIGPNFIYCKDGVWYKAHFLVLYGRDEQPLRTLVIHGNYDADKININVNSFGNQKTAVKFFHQITEKSFKIEGVG
jgi:hypothetical protein